MSEITAIVVNDFGHVNGGASKVALCGALALAKAGYDVRLFVAVPPVSNELNEAGIPVICTQQHEIARDPNRARAAAQGIWNVHAASLFDDLLRKLDPARTVVHVHGWSKALSASVVRRAVDRGFAITATLHDYFIICPNGGVFDYQTKNICMRAPGSLHCFAAHCDARRYSHKVWRVVRHAVQTRAFAVASGVKDVIAVSEFSRRLFERELPPATRVHIVPNPVTCQRENPVSVGDNQTILYVGRLAYEKGPLLLARAARHLGLSPTFVGDGELRADILRQCPDAKITGWVESRDLRHYWRKARALVFPSLLYETQGLAVLEALAQGIPVVVPGRGAAAELVAHGETGLCFTSGDERDLADQLTVVADAKRASAMGAKAYDAYWKAPLTLDNHVASLASVYERMLDERSHLTGK